MTGSVRWGKIRLHPEVRFREIDGDGVLVHLDTGKTTVVNSVGIFLVRILHEQEMGWQELVGEMVNHYDIDQSIAEKDLTIYLDELVREQLVAEIGKNV